MPPNRITPEKPRASSTKSDASTTQSFVLPFCSLNLWLGDLNPWLLIKLIKLIKLKAALNLQTTHPNHQTKGLAACGFQKSNQLAAVKSEKHRLPLKEPKIGPKFYSEKQEITPSLWGREFKTSKWSGMPPRKTATDGNRKMSSEQRHETKKLRGTTWMTLMGSVPFGCSTHRGGCSEPVKIRAC